MLKIVVDSVGTQLQVRTFDMGVSLYLGGIYVQHLEYKGEYSLDLKPKGVNFSVLFCQKSC